MTGPPQHSTWFGEMITTWALAGGGMIAGVGHVLQGLIAVLAVSASVVSAWIGYRRYQWERADRAERAADRRSDRKAARVDRNFARADRQTARENLAADRAARGSGSGSGDDILGYALGPTRPGTPEPGKTAIGPSPIEGFDDAGDNFKDVLR